MIDGFRLLAAGVGGLALLGAGTAGAEVLQVTRAYPAQSDRAAAMRTIAVESFGGPDGPDLVIRVEDALRSAEIDGQRYFRLLPGAPSRDADGVLRGSATAEISRTRYTETRKRCVTRTDGKCTERREEEVRCSRRTITLVPAIRLIARNGDLVHSDNQPDSVQDSHCEDASSRPEEPEAVVRTLANKTAVRLRAALVPSWRRESIRVMEDRKGLSREDGDRFRNALRLTRTDAGAACRQWDAIASANPDHAATVFNLGLCAEAADDIDDAERGYRRAAQLSQVGSIAEGLQRLDARRRMAQQLDAHSRSR